MKFTTAISCAISMSMLGMTAYANGPESMWENLCRSDETGGGGKYACFESQDGPALYQAPLTKNDFYIPGAD